MFTFSTMMLRCYYMKVLSSKLGAAKFKAELISDVRQS
jgi:hypothetical protein